MRHDWGKSRREPLSTADILGYAAVIGIILYVVIRL